jgi:hypothetical protein
MEMDEERHWFAYPPTAAESPLQEPVGCPGCGEPFTRAAALRCHLIEVHGHRRARVERLPGLRRWVRSFGWLPLWFVFPTNATLMALVFLALRGVDPLLAVYAASLSSFPLVLVLAHRIFHGRG